MLGASRDGERIFPAPPRPVEKTLCQEAQALICFMICKVLTSLEWLVTSSLPRVTEKSSGPDSGLSDEG